MHLRACDFDAHASDILDILNEAILTSTALYDYAPRSPASMRTWFERKAEKGFPVIGAFSDDGRLAGFATYGAFRDFPAYKYTVEHSVYVHKDWREQGVAKRLMQALIEAARQQELHVLIGAIDAGNIGSIAMHRSLGFEHAGTLSQVGFKFGRWLDVVLYQLILGTPQHPVDG